MILQVVAYACYEDVKSAIRDAVALDFNQFCRTTMLAQGEFTRFLKSDEGDKAAILEKLTKFTEYTRAGKLSDQLEAAGIVGPNKGPKGRDVLIQDLSQLDQLLEELGVK